ncbi:uncharacterized protein LOC132302749 [Cornus florida]|uniref:uncharacterized protein LOC132302749 n=1 Tax=Cornus florida TaxID=4283 RepID=UPI0028A15C0C|nr:uncharacterized protein LOC132302749 [Cornus florida]
MAKPDDEKSDGLEIVSIGTLYSGAWEKKYWSSSRGKDRYPYPVGYQAVRTHNGITYKMEIHEALKGPLFVITSTDGQSCSGQTPDIAWENHQKKGYPRIKLWRGKRFSCKIDGVEFFGFRNPFVQRLLRELVANVDGTAEQSLLPSSFHNGASGTNHHTQCTNSSNSDLLPYLGKTSIIGKRSRKEKTTNLNLVNGAVHKRLRPQVTHSAEVSNSRQETLGNHNSGNSTTSSASDEEHGICNNLGAFPASLKLETVAEGDNVPSSSKDGLSSESFQNSDHLKEKVLPQEENKLVNSENCIVTGIASNLYTYDEPLNRSKDAEIQGFSLSMATENTVGEAPVPKDTDVDLFAPDTLDLLCDNIPDSALHNGSPYNVKGELVAVQVVISEGSLAESHPEEDIGTSNASSEKSDFDSVGDDIDKSMMTVLLPQALPLLRTFSRKKKATVNPSGISLHTMKTQKEHNGTDRVDVASPVEDLTERSPLERLEKEKMHILSTDHSSVFPITPIVPDSFENDHCGDDVPSQLPLFPEVSEAGLATLGQHTFTYTFALPVSVDVPKGSSISHVEISNSKKTCSYDAVHMASTERREKSNILVSESTSGSTSPLKNIFVEGNNDKCTNTDESSTFLEICSKENEFKSTPDCAEEKSHACVDKELLRQQNLVEFNDSVSSLQKQGTSFCDDSVENKDGSDLKPHMTKAHKDDPEGVELVGCYSHPMPVSSVLLKTNGNAIYICVLCGILPDSNRTLFLYKVSIKEQNVGCPSFIGHMPIVLPVLRDAFGREIALDGSGLQFTPDGQFLVLLNSIKAPYCREGKVHCPCSACTSDSFEQNAVKIVQVKLGYVSVLVKMKKVHNVYCILVCEPNYLVGVGDSGKLHLWVMNSTWSAQTDECDLPTSDCSSPGIVELKRVPNWAAFVVGHNGFGEFSLWDISKRILVSKFSAPSTSVIQFLPISLFRWQGKDSVSTYPNGKEHINEIMAATNISKQGENRAFLPMQEEDMAIWLLISTVSDSDVQQGYRSSDCKINPVGWWRLALLVKNIVILGNALDPRAAAIGASAGHGIIGTCDGLVYMWELSTGTKLGNLHYFKDAGVSCIATDDSRSGALAVACGSQLLVYLHAQGAFSN